MNQDRFALVSFGPKFSRWPVQAPQVSHMLPAGILGFIAALATYGGVAYFRLWAERRQILDVPNERSSHTRPTPRGGGLVIVVVTLLCGSLLAAVYASPGMWSAYFTYLAGALLVAVVSWLDDLRSLPSLIRLSTHLLAALVAVAGLGYWERMALPLLGTVTPGWWGAVIGAAWIVGLTNAYNFMDGTDGIASGQALVAGLGWALLGWGAGLPLVGGLGLLVACASLGFLIHNWPPARIFMGDVGSAFLGYTLAVLPLMYGFFRKDSAGVPVVGLLLVWPFVFDTVFTFFRRLSRRENVFAAHRSHLYQRMSSAHSGHARVALLYSGLALVGCLLARVWSTRAATGAVTTGIIIPFLCLGLWVFVVIQERREKPRCTASSLAAFERRDQLVGKAGRGC
jgi:UDP-N-acetylmuramyl pentapeptide phosphotransferase/UDP-N-acetylglucosamine-1-phosphate transferase